MSEGASVGAVDGTVLYPIAGIDREGRGPGLPVYRAVCCGVCNGTDRGFVISLCIKSTACIHTD